MRILVTCFTYLPRRDGVQFVTTYLCEGLAVRGHEVTVLTHLRDGFPECEVINGVSVERWPISTRHMRHYGPRKELVSRVVGRQDEYDALINVCTQSPMTDWLLPHLDEIEKPKLLHIHSIWDFAVHAWDRSTVSKLSRKLVANARWGVYYMINGKHFKRYDRIFQLYEQDYSVADFRKWYGIAGDILENAAEDSFHIGAPVPESARRKSIVCVANYTRQKNQTALVEAFLKSDIPDGWRLDFVGSRETPELEAMQKTETLIRSEQGLPDVAHGERLIFYHVGISREETIQLVKTSSVLAMSSMWEAFPISLVEAMSAGVPWVSTDVGIARYLPGGIVVPSPDAIEPALEQLCANEIERARLGREGYDYAAVHFRIEDKVSYVENTLLELTGGRIC